MIVAGQTLLFVVVQLVYWLLIYPPSNHGSAKWPGKKDAPNLRRLSTTRCFFGGCLLRGSETVSPFPPNCRRSAVSSMTDSCCAPGTGCSPSATGTARSSPEESLITNIKWFGSAMRLLSQQPPVGSIEPKEPTNDLRSSQIKPAKLKSQVKQSRSF